MTQNYTLYAVWARTVLYQDDTLIINELPTASRQDATKAVYDAMLPDGSNYVFSSYSNVLWYSNRTLITSVEIGSDISPASTKYWFYEMSNCTSIDLTKLDTSSVTTMEGMFYGCSKLTSLDVSKFDTSRVTDMQTMFYYCSSLTRLDVSKFNTSSVTNMQIMFRDCSSLTSLDVSKFDTSSVTTMNQMFYGCSELTSIIFGTSFDTSRVTTMSNMFNSCSQLATIYASSNFVTNKVTSDSNMFSSCSVLVGGQNTAYDANNVDKTYARIDDPSNGNPGYFTEK